MSDEIHEKCRELLGDLSKAPDGFELEEHVKDNNHGNTQVIPFDAKTWEDVEEIVITEDISETRTYTYTRR